MSPEPLPESPAPAVPEGGVTIPGYQPVEMLGNSPSYGAWVRAIQVRMDRRVLLKVLRPGLPVAHEYFAREIASVVRFDGDGVLRAIDEGTVRGYRYLVVDEADGIPLSAEGLGGEEGGIALVRAALGLWRRVLDEDTLLLPVPATAWRRLPAGDFVVADLGWLVPLGSPVPQHPSLSREIVGRPARASDAIRTFEIAGRSLSALLGASLAGPLRRALATLTGIPEDAGRDAVAAALASAAEALAPKRAPRALIFGMAAAAIAVAAVWGTIAFLGSPQAEPETSGDPHVATGDGTAETLPGGASEPAPAEDPAAVMRREAELRAWAALDSILPDPPAELPADAPSLREPLPASRIAELSRFAEEHPGTRAAEVALHELEADRSDRIIILEEEWRRVHDGFAQELAAGRLAAAEAILEPFRARFAAERGAELIPELEAALGELQRTLLARAAAVRGALDGEVAAARAARRYRKIAIDLGRALPGLISEDRAWAERVRGSLLEEADRYETMLRSVDEAIARAHERAGAGEFSGATGALVPLPGEEEFPELAGRRAEWAELIARAVRFAEAIAGELARPERADRVHPYKLAAGEKVRGRIVRLAPTGFDLKLEGLVETRAIRWIDLADDQRLELAGGESPPTVETHLLLLHLLGEPGAVTRAAALAPPPPWLEDARLRTERLANADLGRWLAEGRAAQAEGRAAAARDAARAIAKGIPARLWESERAELEEWCRGHWRATGPAAAFPGATVSWGADRAIVLAYDFSREEAMAGWVPTAAGRGRRRLAGKAMEAVGSVRLTAAGDVDLFEETLAVTASLVPREKTAPNLNVVLFARSDGDVARGDLFALGFRPPESRVPRIEGESPVFLPANVCGPLEAAERGDGSQLALARVEPRVPAGEKVDIAVRSAPESLSFAWQGKFEETFPAAAGRVRRGTVEFVTYHSVVLVGSLEIRATLAAGWWGRWVGERVEEDLGRAN